MDDAPPSRDAHGESPWVRFLLPTLAVLWLGELAAPISHLFQTGLPPALMALALVGAALFVATYLWVVWDAVRARAGAHPPSSPGRVWTPDGHPG